MSETHYTPKIEHFHVGFRYERRNHDNTWRKTEFNTNDNLSYFETCLNDGTFRVKSLDHEDIKEAGWKEKITSGRSSFWNNGKYSLHLNFETSRAEIILKENEYNYMKFVGKIANYNKLLDVMEMLEIGNNK